MVHQNPLTITNMTVQFACSPFPARAALPACLGCSTIPGRAVYVPPLPRRSRRHFRHFAGVPASLWSCVSLAVHVVAMCDVTVCVVVVHAISVHVVAVRVVTVCCGIGGAAVVVLCASLWPCTLS